MDKSESASIVGIVNIEVEAKRKNPHKSSQEVVLAIDPRSTGGATMQGESSGSVLTNQEKKGKLKVAQAFFFFFFLKQQGSGMWI